MITFIKAKILLLTVAIIWLLMIAICLPIQLPITLASPIAPSDKFRRYVRNWWLWQDQAINAILGGNIDVTISSKVGYMANVKGSKTAKSMEVVIDYMFYLAIKQDRHCLNSIEKDELHYE